jgi:diguanylate cyclase (GGDEF)-like protein
MPRVAPPVEEETISAESEAETDAAKPFTVATTSEFGTSKLGLKQLPWFILLSGAAMLLNTVPLPLYFGIHLLLGSVPPILALLLWRSWWAVPMGTLASLHTWRLWGHPWAIVIFTLELVWLCIGLRRFNGPARQDSNGRVVLFTIAYWLLLGLPLVLVFYGVVLRLDTANITVVAVKQSFNGVFNAVLAFSCLIGIRAIQARRHKGPGLSLRGVILGLALFAITVPTLVISITAWHQLEQAVQRGVLDGLRTVNLAVSRSEGESTINRLLIGQLGGDLAYRRIEADGRTQSSDPALFARLDADFSDGGRSHVRDRELAILIPRNKGPLLRKWVNGYWSYSRQYGGGNPGNTFMVQVVQPSRTIVMRMQQQSSTLLGVTYAVLVLGSLAGNWVGKRFEQELSAVVKPLERAQGQLEPLNLSSLNELRDMTVLINHRIRQVNRLSGRLRQSNAKLQQSHHDMYGQFMVDPLTGCGNLQALDDRLNEEWQRCLRSGEPLACLCIDVDGFRLISGLVGREAGRTYVQHLAQAVASRLGIGQHLYRIGMDTFVVLVMGCQVEAAKTLGQRLQQAANDVGLGADHDHGSDIEPTMGITVSVGIGWLDPSLVGAETQRRKSAETLLSAAQQALQNARKRGPGQLELRSC